MTHLLPKYLNKVIIQEGINDRIDGEDDYGKSCVPGRSIDDSLIVKKTGANKRDPAEKIREDYQRYFPLKSSVSVDQHFIAHGLFYFRLGRSGRVGRAH